MTDRAAHIDPDATLTVVEKFVSINGEGRNAGKLAAFIRLRRCNLSCSYCDTAWANAANSPAEELSVAQLCAWVASTGVRYVTLTGGEPLLQSESIHLVCALLSGFADVRSDLVVEIETNGSLPLDTAAQLRTEHPWAARLLFTMDWKLPRSGMADHMLVSNLAFLGHSDVLKCVTADEDDLNYVLQLIHAHDLEHRTQVYLSPVFGDMQPARLVAFMEEHGLYETTLQIQLHKVIWDPSERGV